MTLARDPQTAMRHVARDRFTDDRPAGGVIGTQSSHGETRLGVDVEGVVGIDNGALRIQPLSQPGWGRAGIAYGPFHRIAGLAMCAHVLNGHNASQTFYFPESRRERVRRVLSDLVHRRPRRQHHYENLAVGFLPSPDTPDPLRNAHTLVMHAATEDNGELWAAVDGRSSRIVRGVLNLPFLFVVVLRDDGAAYYTSSLPGATGAATYPWLRPVGIDHSSPAGPLVAAVQQRILGEVGYRVDTRVYGVDVSVVDEWSNWWGSAHAADAFTISGPLNGRRPDVGAPWQADDALVISDEGLRNQVSNSPASGTLAIGAPSGLLHTTVAAGDPGGRFELQWRLRPDGAHVALRIDGAGCSIQSRGLDGEARTLVSDDRARLVARSTHALQVLDDGSTIAAYLDGVLVGDVWTSTVGIEDGDDVSLVLEGGVRVRRLEAHPRQVALPAVLDCGPPWQPPASVSVLDERFDTNAADLHGTTTPSGQRPWSRVEGSGTIEVLGDHARVRADRAEPNAGRTIFTIPWDHPDFADLELDMTIPGSERGEGHNGRCGVVFWQDPENYLVVNFFVDDVFDGASISTFYHLDGREEMYDAVWTLVPGVSWGRRCTLRAAFDGERFLAYTNGEPSLVRALRDVYPDTPPLRIEQVGIIVNREWGDDTGSLLHRFSAGRRAAAS